MGKMNSRVFYSSKRIQNITLWLFNINSPIVAIYDEVFKMEPDLRIDDGNGQDGSCPGTVICIAGR